MKKSLLNFTFIILTIINTQLLMATTYTTVQDGPWASASTWDANGVPPTVWSTGNTISINHSISLSADLSSLHHYTTTINTSGEITGAYKITLNSAGTILNNYGTIDVKDFSLGYNTGDAILNNYGNTILSGTLTIGADVINKYISSTVHGYIETNDLLLNSSGKLENNHHIKVINDLTISGSSSLDNKSTATLYVVNNLNITENTTINNDGKVYVDGTIDLSNGNLTGSGGQCNSDGATNIPTSSGGSIICSSGIGPIDSTFPIELIMFIAKTDGSSIILEWTTASEENNHYFSIEQSMDTKIWKEIDTKRGGGNSNKILNYTFIDKNPIDGINYYRLKQTDYDGQYSYSQIVMIGINSSKLKANPNPTIDFVNIKLNGINANNILIYNVMGQNVSNKVAMSGESSNKIVLDLSLLPTGTYIISTENGFTKVFKQ